jgi:hypothetical protein
MSDIVENITLQEVVEARNQEVLRLNKVLRDCNIKYQIVYDEIPSKRKWVELIRYNEKAKDLPPYYILFRPLREIKNILKEKVRYDKSIK